MQEVKWLWLGHWAEGSPQGQSRRGLLNCGLDANHLLCKYIFYVRGLQGELHAQGRLEPEEFHVQVIAKTKNMKLSFEKSCWPSFTVSPFSYRKEIEFWLVRFYILQKPL